MMSTKSKENLSKTRLVIFDFDGVLFDGFDQVWTILCNLFKKHNFTKIQTKEDFRTLFLKNFYVATEELGLDICHNVVLKEEIKQAIERDFNPAVFAGMSSAVRLLAGKAVLAIESSNFEGTMRRLLRENGMEDCFKYVVGADSVSSKTERLKQLLTDVNPERVVFITDTVGDVVEAQVLSVPVIGVAWGYHSYQQLKKAQPLVVVRTPAELVQKVEMVLDG